MLEEPVSNDARTSVASLEDYLDAVRKHKWLVIAAAVSLLAVAMLYTTSRSDRFEATARVVVEPTPVGSLDGRLVAPKLDREVEIIAGDAVLSKARKLAGVGPKAGLIEPTFQPLSDVLQVVVTAAKPEQAANIANAVAKVYVDERVLAQADFYGTAEAKVAADLSEVQARVDINLKALSVIDVERQRLISEPASPERAGSLDQLSADRGSAQGNLNSDLALARTIRTTLAGLQQDRVTQAPAARVIKEAAASTTPVGLNEKVFWIAGLVLGLILGAILAFLRQRLDRSASGTRDVELALGTKVVGSVPSFGWRFGKGHKGPIMGGGYSGPAAERAREAYRRLRSSVLYLSRASDVKSVVVTSNKAEEGKSTTAANLAMAASMGDTKTVLVSADLRRSSLETTLNVGNDRGLSDYLTGITDDVHSEPVDGFANLTLIPSGPIPSNPGELLNSQRFAELIKKLEAEYELVVVDTAPVGVTADAVGAARFTDGVLVVVDGKRTNTTDLMAVRREFDRTGVTILGAVMNRDVSLSSGLLQRRSYGYYRKK
jgi:capsular exopolysaccharide synthesis family protein